MLNCRCIDRYVFCPQDKPILNRVSPGVISTSDRKPFTAFRHLNLYICDPRYRLTFIFEISSAKSNKPVIFFVGRIGRPLELSYSPIGLMYAICTYIWLIF